MSSNGSLGTQPVTIFLNFRSPMLGNPIDKEETGIVCRILGFYSNCCGSDKRFSVLVGVIMRRVRRIVKKMKFFIEYENFNIIKINLLLVFIILKDYFEIIFGNIMKCLFLSCLQLLGYRVIHRTRFIELTSINHR